MNAQKIAREATRFRAVLLLFLIVLIQPNNAVAQSNEANVVEPSSRHFVIVIRDTTMMQGYGLLNDMPNSLAQLMFDELPSKFEHVRPKFGDSVTILLSAIGLEDSTRRTAKGDLCPQHRTASGAAVRRGEHVSLDTFFFHVSFRTVGVSTSSTENPKKTFEKEIESAINDACAFWGDTFWPNVAVPAALEFLSNASPVGTDDKSPRDVDPLQQFILVVVDGMESNDPLNKYHEYLLEDLRKAANAAESQFRIRPLGTFGADLSEIYGPLPRRIGLRYRVFEADHVVSVWHSNQTISALRMTIESQRREILEAQNGLAESQRQNDMLEEKLKNSAESQKQNDILEKKLEEMAGEVTNLRQSLEISQSKQSALRMWLVGVSIFGLIVLLAGFLVMRLRLNNLNRIHREQLAAMRTAHQEEMEANKNVNRSAENRVKEELAWMHQELKRNHLCIPE